MAVKKKKVEVVETEIIENEIELVENEIKFEKLEIASYERDVLLGATRKIVHAGCSIVIMVIGDGDILINNRQVASGCSEVCEGLAQIRALGVSKILVKVLK